MNNSGSFLMRIDKKNNNLLIDKNVKRYSLTLQLFARKFSKNNSYSNFCEIHYNNIRILRI